ncbi:hypothetical protein PUR49_00240, partial [Streptomyces sp. BE147]|nr:hypothetical protein [Streptomyces sp. BE147]
MAVEYVGGGLLLVRVVLRMPGSGVGGVFQIAGVGVFLGYVVVGVWCVVFGGVLFQVVGGVFVWVGVLGFLGFGWGCFLLGLVVRGVCFFIFVVLCVLGGGVLLGGLHGGFLVFLMVLGGLVGLVGGGK